jgi:Icc-related predicted phosphoesterase
LTIDSKNIRIAAVGDLHCGKNSQGVFQEIFKSIADVADILVLCGDLTDYGTPEEARILAQDLSNAVHIPMVGVLGNHDFESGKQDEVRQIFQDKGITILDGESHEILGIGFAGAKGFMGGFGRYSLGAWGEQAIKNIVNETLTEALKLDSALARLRTRHQIVILHYSPIAGTVEGEPTEIWPFLGNSRLEEPLLRHEVTTVFHGHAHKGTLEGKLMSGVPVYNVAMPLLRAKFPDAPPYRIFEYARENTDTIAQTTTAGPVVA